MQTAVYKRLERIIETEMGIAEHNAIFEDVDGYHAFGMYQIQKEEQRVAVWLRQEPIHYFGSLKSAISWCIAEKYKQYTLSRDIALADSDIDRLANDVSATMGILPTIQDRDRRRVVRDKLEHKQAQLKQAQDRLSKCVNLAKYFQIRGFNDELARTRRTTPNQTNRSRDRKPSRTTH